jgi:hypothetical protein
VQAKKTQRDKDWPMIRRLVEANFFENRGKAGAARIRFWLQELRTPQLLIGVAQNNSRLTRQLSAKRPLLRIALAGEVEKLGAALADEESAEREKDRLYWLPLRKELEQLRHSRV